MATSLVRCRPQKIVAISLITLVTISIVLPFSTADEAPPLTWYKIWSKEGHDVAYGVDSFGGSIYVTASSGVYTNGVSTFLLKYNSDGELIWERDWAMNQVNEAHSVAASEKGIYISGLTGDIDKFEAFLLNYDHDGNLIWSKVWGEDQMYWVQNIVVYGSNIYLAGSKGNQNDYSAFLLKFDSDGNLIWSKTYGEGIEGPAKAYGVTVSGDAVYLAGSTGDDENSDAFLLKFDTDGNRVWTKVWANDKINEAHSVTVSGNKIYVAGWILSQENDIEDAFLLKFDSDGNLTWSRIFGDIESEGAYGVAVSGDSVFVAGKKGFFQRYGTLLLRYTTEGELIWWKTYERSRYGGAYGITISGDSIYTAGVTWGIGAGYYEAALYKFPLGQQNTHTGSSQIAGAKEIPLSVIYALFSLPVIGIITVALFWIRRHSKKVRSLYISKS